MDERSPVNEGDCIDDDFDVEVRGLISSDSTENLLPDYSSKAKEQTSGKSVAYISLFRYADCIDCLMLVVGGLAAAAHGSGLPLMFLFFGRITDSFTNYGKFAACHFNYTLCTDEGLFNGTEAEFNKTVAEVQDLDGNTDYLILYLVYIACGVIVCATLQTGAYCYQAARQSNRIRVEYVRGVLRQNIGYHDVNSPGEINARLSDDVKKIYDGIADKVSLTFQHLSLIGFGLFLAFWHSWKLSLVALAVTPLIVVGVSLVFMIAAKYAEKELDAYAVAGSIAEEAIAAIRTVVAFGIQEECHNRYTSNLKKAKVLGIKRGAVAGMSIGFLYFAMYTMYAVTFWYGVKLVLTSPEDHLSPGDMMIVFYNILIAAFSLGTSGSNMEYFTAAKAAGQKIFEVIDRIPSIDIFSEVGLKPNDVSGEISFNDVDFSYPSRSDVQVLKGVNFSVKKGQTVALVGQSGCGKSTCVSLIQRFYDVQSGSVEIDDVDVRTWNIKWLRDNIGVVAQEPILFDTTIAENIRWGREGVTDDEIVEAARQANAYDFIRALPKKFETLVGESGGQMSGGQKQRIAIARAIVRDPKILLLDEATSALDTESEAVVQSALDKAATGRTTIMIAHRLSTIRNADKIVAFHQGRVMEEGTHDELMKMPDGVYANLVNMQIVNASKNPITPIPEEENQWFPAASIAAAKAIRGPRRHLSSVSSQHSHGIGQDEAEDEEEEKENLPDAPLRRMLILNKPEWGYMIFGCVFALIAGSVDSLNAIIFPQVLTIFTIGNQDQQLHQSLIYALMFLGLGLIALIGYTTDGILFSKSGMELTTRFRKAAFRSMLRQDIAYFDDHRHSTGALTTRLATDASRVQACTGVRLGTILKNISSLFVALGIGFAFGWKLTLVASTFIPFLIIGGFLEISLLIGEAEREKKAYEESGKIAAEATLNIRTVASLTKEEKLFKLYEKSLEKPAKNANRKAIVTGIGFGFSQCVMYFAYAGILRYGVYLVENNEMSFENVFRVISAVIFGAAAVGQNSSFAPDYAEGKVSAKRMFALFDSRVLIDAYSDEGHRPHHCTGNIKFQSVRFTYPTRPDSLVLKGCDFTVPAGRTVALVGQSGCGKSTCIQLIERFYDTEEGEVLLDGCDVKKLNVSWLRQQIGIVSQEPVLFDLSIKENILLGDRTRSYTDDEIRASAIDANIHDFIISLPQGYDTKVGVKGGQLSGGQKQRIAIARALLRKPAILLLDEATSALDTESEKVVQDALDKAREGRTCVVVAHRLSTVKNADVIVVVDNGVIVETGTHDELVRRRGAYYSLVNAQLTHQEE